MKNKKMYFAINNNSGFTVSQLMAYLLVSAISSLVISQSIIELVRIQRENNVRSAINTAKVDLISIVSSDYYWNISKDHWYNHRFFKGNNIVCVQHPYTGPDSMKIFFGNQYIPPVDCRGQSGVIDLYTHSSPKIFDQWNIKPYFRNGKNSGFDMNGKPCRSPDVNLCPIGAEVIWEVDDTDCPAIAEEPNCYTPSLIITVKFRMRKDPAKFSVGGRLMAINLDKYDLKIKRSGGF